MKIVFSSVHELTYSLWNLQQLNTRIIVFYQPAALLRKYEKIINFHFLIRLNCCQVQFIIKSNLTEIKLILITINLGVPASKQNQLAYKGMWN